MTINDIPSHPTKKKYEKAPDMFISPDNTYTATIKTNKGDITIELFAKTAPITVNNFVFLAKSGFYNNTIFHRVIPDFVIQGGDPLGNGMGNPGYKFQDEFSKDSPDMSTGTLAMANAGPGTNGSQFFICLNDLPYLKGKHTIFGKVTQGMETVTKIEQEATDFADKPIKDITVKQIDIHVS